MDFTLKEFNVWKNLLSIAKKQRFINTSLQEFMQIVYYQLAIMNYKGAAYFLNKCQQDDNQVKYLRILMTFDIDKLFESGHSLSGYTPPFTGLYDYFSVLELALDKYLPAMLLTRYFIQLYPITLAVVAERGILDKLIRINQNMLEMNVDILFINLLKSNINILNSKISGPSQKFWTGIAYIKNINLFKIALEGSDVALLELLDELKYVRIEQNHLIFRRMASNWLRDIDPIYLLTSFPIIKEILLNKILENNFKVVIGILKICGYPNSVGNLDDDIFDLLNPCIEQIYKHILNVGDNFQAIAEYLRVLSITNTNITITSKHEAICKEQVINVLSIGLLFHDLFRNTYRLIINDIYSKWPIETDDLADTINYAMVDLMENFFWLEEPDYETYFFSRRLHFLGFLFKLSPFLWKATLCVLGINTINYKRTFSSKLILIYKNHCEPPITFVSPRHICMILINIFTNMERELLELESTYLVQFGISIDKLKLNKLLLNCENARQLFTNSGSLEIEDNFETILFLFEMDIFCQEYRLHLNKHEKYKPGGKRYSNIVTHFNNIIRAMPNQ